MLDIDNKIIAFFKKLDREYFMDFNKEYAYLDEPLSIGHGQTISQPSLVLEMTMRLDLSLNILPKKFPFSLFFDYIEENTAPS